MSTITKILFRLGPTFFESISIASIAVSINLFTSISILFADRSRENYNLTLIWLLIIISFVVFLFSSYYSKILNTSFSSHDTSEKIRGSIRKQIEDKKCNVICFPIFVLSVVSFIVLVVCQLF